MTAVLLARLLEVAFFFFEHFPMESRQTDSYLLHLSNYY